MSRKHFIAMAKEISNIQNVEARKQAANAFASVAITVNSDFNRTRFMEACGL